MHICDNKARWVEGDKTDECPYTSKQRASHRSTHRPVGWSVGVTYDDDELLDASSRAGTRSEIKVFNCSNIS